MADPHKPADQDAQAYLRGSQAIGEQESTYSLFMSLAKWGSLAIGAVLLFLTLWFQPGGSFVMGAGAAVVFAVVGFFALKSKPAAH
ncbi:aa3-type cytochrome c oxidase subunit IV [Brevundimonas sp.]|uniref:aa3-type cytochrome c oxidase subunit IV n=1 Tax=Brevundimonas sp. TaxID=1871086 RepID=UPI002AB8BB5C|nr:aa3-type cytochrome c oxidase subunit IV [Brevundimonas sp.]MDZ4363616.1 aa3-type cytochrome c oxidase subunit IV [Brevundimonas sp.]